MTAPVEVQVGVGAPSYSFQATTGTLKRFASPQDVIASIDDDLESTIALVQSGGTTFLSPILGRLGGIVALDGTIRSHLGIVSREFEVACLLGTTIEVEVEDGTEVTLDSGDGTLGTLSLASPRGQDYEAFADLSRAWWDYIRAIGDDIAVKPFGLVVGEQDLASLIEERMSDEQLDQLVQHMGRTFKPEMTRRSAFTSELFPMLPYMCLSTIEDFHTYGDRVRAIDEAMPAQEIGRQLRAKAGAASPLWTWMSAYHYLCGRECLIQMGTLRRDEHLDDIRAVVDFWRRLTLAQRGDGTLDNKDAGFSNRYLPQDEVARLQAETSVLDAASTKTLKRLNATVSGYSFLYFTDSRVGIYDSGPYPAGEGRVSIVRDYLCLQPSDFGYEWAADLTAPYSALTLVLTFDPAAFTSFEINDWGTTFTEPEQLIGSVTAAAVIGHQPDGTRTLVDPSQWAGLMTDISKTHMQLYETFAAMTREERIFAATRMYSWGLKPFAALAGVIDEIDWSLSAKTRALYPEPLDDDDRAGAIFGTALVANDMLGSFSPLG